MLGDPHGHSPLPGVSGLHSSTSHLPGSSPLIGGGGGGGGAPSNRMDRDHSHHQSAPLSSSHHPHPTSGHHSSSHSPHGTSSSSMHSSHHQPHPSQSPSQHHHHHLHSGSSHHGPSGGPSPSGSHSMQPHQLQPHQSGGHHSSHGGGGQMQSHHPQLQPHGQLQPHISTGGGGGGGGGGSGNSGGQSPFPPQQMPPSPMNGAGANGGNPWPMNVITESPLRVCKLNDQCDDPNCPRMHGEFEPKQDEFFKLYPNEKALQVVCVWNMRGFCRLAERCGYRHLKQLFPNRPVCISVKCCPYLALLFVAVALHCVLHRRTYRLHLPVFVWRACS